MYFPGDPLLPLDPIFNAVPDARARERMVAAFDLVLTEPAFALGYRFDLVLRGRDQTPMEALTGRADAVPDRWPLPASRPAGRP